MNNEERINRFHELSGRCPTVCTACQMGAPPVETEGSWFHIVSEDGTYSAVPSPAAMMEPCAAGGIRTEMETLRAELV